VLEQILAKPAEGHVGVVLGREHHGLHLEGPAVLVLHGDLGLAVGAQIGQDPLLADLGQALGEAVGQGDRQRHQLGRVLAGVAVHDALVARPQALVGVLGLLLEHGLGDVGGLLVDRDEHRAAVVGEAVLGLGVAPSW